MELHNWNRKIKTRKSKKFNDEGKVDIRDKVESERGSEHYQSLGKIFPPGPKNERTHKRRKTVPMPPSLTKVVKIREGPR